MPVAARAVGPLWDDRGRARLRDLVALAVRAGAGRIEGATARETPVNTGALRASLGSFVWTGPDWVRGAVGSPVAYAPYVEYGTRPHWPPLAPLEAWARRKFTLGSGAEATKEARSIARRVAFAISKRGTKAARMLRHAFARAGPQLPRYVGQAVDRWKREMNGAARA